MLQLLHEAPTDISNIIFRMRHEMDLSEVLTKLITNFTIIRRIELAFQAYARDGKLRISQYTGGMVGQSITYTPYSQGVETDINLGNFIHTHDLGHFWYTYNTEHMQMIEDWNSTREEGAWSDENIAMHYGNWMEDLGNGLTRIRLMINEIPLLPEFEDFHGIDEQELFWSHFPGFFPVEVIIPASCVRTINVALTQHQMAVKYNFEEDVDFARKQIHAMGMTETIQERNVLIAELLEFLIIKPSMLIHSSKLRNVIHGKLDEFMDLADKYDDTRKEDRRYIRNLVYRMATVLSIIVDDPLYVAD